MEMDLDDVSEDDNLLASLDIILLEVQKDVTRNTVIASTVATLQGLMFLFLAWLADGFITTVVIGVVGGVVFILSFLVTFTNFRTYLKVFANVQNAKENHPAIETHSAIQDHFESDTSEDDDSA